MSKSLLGAQNLRRKKYDQPLMQIFEFVRGNAALEKSFVEFFPEKFIKRNLVR